jgi:hypothetical protein
MKRRSGDSGFHRFNAPKMPGGNYLTDLRRRGLIALMPRSRAAGEGSGRADGLYLLSPSAMQLLTEVVAR